MKAAQLGVAICLFALSLSGCDAVEVRSVTLLLRNDLDQSTSDLDRVRFEIWRLDEYYYYESNRSGGIGANPFPGARLAEELEPGGEVELTVPNVYDGYVIFVGAYDPATTNGDAEPLAVVGCRPDTYHSAGLPITVSLRLDEEERPSLSCSEDP